MTDFIGYILIFFAILLLRYFSTAGFFYAYYSRIKKNPSAQKILSQRPPKKEQVKKEIYWSIISSAIFAIFGALTYWLWLNNMTAIYINPAEFGYWYLPLSLLIVLLVHKVHHQSLSTTPWTAFSFHPWESVLEALIVPLMLLIIPVNIYVLLFYLIIMTFSSVINHLDIEVYPASFRKSTFGKLWIDATHHHFHHKEFNTNYGLYFTFWDKLMGTESRKMEEKS